MKKRVITNEIILDKALQYVIKNGIDILNARSLAKELNCSTQPIYLSFKSMDDLKKQLLVNSKAFISSYIQSRLHEYDTLFMGYLSAFIKFAYEYPKLYEFIYLKMACENSEADQVYNDNIIKGIAKAGGYTYKIAEKFYIQSFIYAHGIATQIATGYIKWDLDIINDLLEDEFIALKLKYKGDEKNGSD